ncbi:MAG TPA: hypothetical protein VF101_19865 [Gaiellaceae bacterium]
MTSNASEGQVPEPEVDELKVRTLARIEELERWNREQRERRERRRRLVRRVIRFGRA